MYLRNLHLLLKFAPLRILRSSLVQAASVYGGASLLNASIPFLLMPLLTRYMSPADYGIVAMFGVLVSFVSPFTGLSIQRAVVRQYYERDKVHMPTYITNCLLILLVSSTLTAIIFFLLSGPISRISSFPESMLWVVMVVSVAGFINSIVLALWRVQVKPFSYGVYQILQTILNVGLSILLVVMLGLAWKGRIQAQLFTTLIFLCVGLMVLKRNGWIKFSFNMNYIKHALRYGVPLIPHSIGGTLITMIDRLFITNMVGLSDVGLYSVGYSFGSIILFLQDSFNQAYSPWLFERLKKNEDATKKKIVQATYVYFLIVLLLALALSFIAPWFLSFFVGKKFAGAYVFVFWIAMGYAFNGMYKMVVNYIFYVQKTYILAWITFFNAIANIPLNYVLIKFNGAVGAAQATCIVFFMSFVLTWALSCRVYKMPWFDFFSNEREQKK